MPWASSPKDSTPDPRPLSTPTRASDLLNVGVFKYIYIFFLLAKPNDLEQIH